MEIKLHFTPEKPSESCKVVCIHYNTKTGTIYAVMDTTYSAEYGMFCTHDGMPKEHYEEHKEEINNYNKSIIAWVYMCDVVNEVFDEING